MPKKLSYATFFNIYLSQFIDEEAQGEVRLNCPLIYYEDDDKNCPNPTEHFYANVEDGTWHCKRCDRSGNARTLITLIHDMFLHTTTQQQYISLSEVRGLKPQTLEDAGFAYDHAEDRWLVPFYTYNPETNEWSDFLNNLGYFYPSSMNEKTRYKIKKSATLPLYLYNPGLHTYPPASTAVICEGEWDTLAAYELFPESEDMILGKPGAGFSVNWLKTLDKSEKVQLFLDNDEAGRKQTAKAIDILSREKNAIEILDWSLIPEAPKDVRDLLIERPDDAADQLQGGIIQYEVAEPVEKEILGKYQTTISDYTEVYGLSQFIDNLHDMNIYLPPDVAMSMAAVFAITNSIGIPGEPLWAFLIGPPSSGKTMFIDSFGGNNERFDNLSKLTAKALVSGWKDETGEEPSYLHLLRDKTLFVKDFTVTLSDTPDTQREVFGLLTDIYDGSVKIPYGNNQVKEFHDLYFNMVAGVTDKVHQHSAATIGERFLRIDYLGKSFDRRQFTRRALDNFGLSKINKDKFVSNTLGFVNYISSIEQNMEIQDEYKEHIIDLSEFIATIRTKVESDKEGMIYKPRPELGGRLAMQLAKLFVSTRTVYTEEGTTIEETSAKAFEVVKKVALDTCYGFPLDVVRCIAENPDIDKQSIVNRTGIHHQRVYRVLTDLQTTGVLSYIKGRPSARGGRPPHHYELNPTLKPVLSYDTKKVTERPRKKYPPSRSRRP